jgi:hypothetical protein
MMISSVRAGFPRASGAGASGFSSRNGLAASACSISWANSSRGHLEQPQRLLYLRRQRQMLPQS